MKKLMCVLLCVICISSLVGCGKNNSELDFSETIRSIDFSMTLDSVKNSANDTLTEEKTAKGQNAFLYYEGELNGYSGEIIYRFDADTGTLDFIKFIFNSDTDFESYMEVYQKMDTTYQDKLKFNKMSLVNISEAGRFAADRSIKEYADRIWGLKPVK